MHLLISGNGVGRGLDRIAAEPTGAAAVLERTATAGGAASKSGSSPAMRRCGAACLERLPQ
ncbi:MAG: hypothetical protein JO038_02795 [Alphaproteobacteria bacterium]|nr:hypothetical protein [Alphaproteobacteria bacterium]